MRLRSSSAIGIASLMALVPSLSRAQIREPNGLLVPDLRNLSGETTLATFFQTRGESIDAIDDAYTAPATFLPRCSFKATLLLRQAAATPGFAWYNTGPNRVTAPAAAELFPLLPPGSPLGAVATAADIQQSPNYAGGEIGFALTGNQVHYTESRWEQLCSNCEPPAPWITALMYSSRTPDAYYVAFEDGSVAATSFNNDGDFNDQVFFVEGVRCREAGLACDSGQAGACAAGVTRCGGVGEPRCEALQQPSSEACDGIDNDCNGVADDGASCDGDQICSKGACVAPCTEGSCSDGRVCGPSGICVDPACADITCEGADLCVNGSCQAPCTGVVCPGETLCRQGACVDACDGVVCNVGDVCVKGTCRAACDECNAPCGAGEACETATGLCRASACVDVVCGDDEVCVEGACVDACDGATCPYGEACSAGHCHVIDITPPVVDAGTDAGDDAGIADAAAPDAGPPGPTDAGVESGVRDAAAAQPDASVPETPAEPLGLGGGCSCDAGNGGVGGSLGLLALLVVLRRRRYGA